MRGEHLDGSIAGRMRNMETARQTLAEAKDLEAERERLVKEGKLRKIVTKVGAHTTIIKYEKI